MLKNYYQILGLNPNASAEEIKKAYRLYATKFHPDKQSNDKFFEEKFKEVKEAYDILSDEKKRADYDLKFNKENFKQEYKYSSTSNSSDWVEDMLDNLEAQRKKEEQKQKKKRKNVYYTSKNLLLNGLYLNTNGQSYNLSEFDKATIRKSSESGSIFLGISLIIIGILTVTLFIGPFIIAFGIFALFYRSYFLVLIGFQGEIPLLKGTKRKMKRVSRLINKAIKENNN